MKKSNYLMLLAVSLVAASCTKKETPNVEPEPEFYTVNLSLGGEYSVDLAEFPLSKAYTDKGIYYGINVYSMKADGSESVYSKYAYGVFDNTDDMVISLASGNKYKFECSILKKGVDWVDQSSGMLGEIFGMYDYSYNKINKFISSTSYSLSAITSGKVYTSSNPFTYKYTPVLDRFYGEVENYVPSSDGKATIDMKRTGFGVKFVCENLPNGVIYYYIKNKNQSNSFSYNVNLDNSIDYISFYGVKEAWQTDNYSEDFEVSIKWTMDDGFSHTIYENKSFVAKRNVLTVFTINLKDFSGETALGFTEEVEPVSTENITIDFTSGGTQVDPK